MSKHHVSTGPGATVVLLALSAALISVRASADPPNDGDAPGTFEEAVLIYPNSLYRGYFQAPEDIDFYKFTVAAGKDINVDCTHHANDGLNSYRVACTASLIDPDGTERAESQPTGPPGDPASRVTFSGAAAGDWRFKIQGTNLSVGQPPSYYDFIVTLTGNGTSGSVALAESGGSTNVYEGGGSDSYTLSLSSQPVADVTITLGPGSQLTVTPVSVTFTSANYSAPQTITVNAVDDAVAEGAHTGTISHTASSADSAYNGLVVQDVIANVTDNDAPAVVVAESSGSTNVTEGGAPDSYSLALTTQPNSDVTITVYPGNQLQASPSTLTFTAENYAAPQTVTATAVDDSAVEGNHIESITHSVGSSDSAYNGISVRDIIVTIVDNDYPQPAGGGSGGGGMVSGLSSLLFGALALLRRSRATSIATTSAGRIISARFRNRARPRQQGSVALHYPERRTPNATLTTSTRISRRRVGSPVPPLSWIALQPSF